VSSRYKANSPEGEFAEALEQKLGRVNPGAFVIPQLQDDPDELDPTNLWMRWDGRLRGRCLNSAGTAFDYFDYPMRSDITAPPAVPPSPVPPPLGAAPKTFKQTYDATWSQSYKGDDSKRTDSLGNDYLVYGNSGDANGVNKALIGFDYAAIASDLNLSTIKKVQLRLENIHAYWASGVTIYFGIHNVTAEPATWPSGSIPRRRITKHIFGKPQIRTASMALDFAKLIRDGTGKGIAIEAPNSSRDFYGYAAGVSSGYTVPQLIVTYAK
jgi:hypothetical protein